MVSVDHLVLVRYLSHLGPGRRFLGGHPVNLRALKLREEVFNESVKKHFPRGS